MGKIKENRFCKQLLYIALTVAIMIIMLPGKSLAANNESSYTVEFTYNGKQYVMNGDTTVELSGILDCIGIAGTPTSVSVSDESLFSATQINGKWTVTAHQAFHTDEWMKVTIDGAEYEIVVTDDETYNISFNVKKIIIDGTEVDAGSKITIGGKDYTFVTMAIIFYSQNAKGVQTSINKMSSSFQTFKGAWSNMSLTFRPKTYRISFMLKPLSDSDEYLLPQSSSYVIKNGSKTVEGFNVSSTSVNVDITTPFVDPTYTAPSTPSASNGTTLTYNGSAQQLVGAGSVSKPVGGTMQYALGNNATSKPTSGWSTTVPTGINSGYYYVWWRIEESGIYNEVTGCCTSYINQASINPTVTMSGWTYGDAASEPSVSGNSGNGEVTYTYKRITSYSGGFTSTKPSTAGTYTVKATISSSPNYTGGTATTDFTIAPREVTLSWSNTALTYNGQSQKPTVTVGNLESGDTCTVTVTGERKNVGSYTATAAGLSNSNYQLPSINTRSCSITKAPLTVSADAKTITYGDAPNNNGVRYIGFMGSDSIYSLTGTLSYYYNYSQYGNVGSYTISPRGLTSDNYDITFTTSILTVLQKEVGLTWSDTSLTYNGSPQKPTAIATGTVNSDAIEVTVTGAQTDAGNDYTATAAALTGEKASNYKLPAANTSNFTINKKAVAVSGITADNKVYDRTTTAVLNTSGASFAGILSGDSLTVSATGTFDNENVGTGKTVTISGLALSGTSVGNYKLAESGNQATATADITAKSLTVNAEAKTKIYGTTDPSFTYTSSGLISGDSFTGELSRDAGENVGTYAIGQGTLSAGDNYTISYTGADLTINKKTLSITADAKTKTYGNADPAFTYNAEGFAYNDTVENVMNGALAREEGEDVRDGGYAISQGSLSAGNNYNISFAGADLTITKRNVTLTSATDSKAYDGTAFTNDDITVGGDGFAEGEGADYNVTGSQTLPGESHNTFTYALRDGTKAGNYTITEQEGTLTVTDRTTDGTDKKYEITVEANSGEATYDGTGHTIDGFVSTEFIINGVTYTVSGLSASASGTDAGEYIAEVTGTAVVKDFAGNDLTDQFIVNTTDGTLTINKRNVTLTSATDSKVYDGDALINREVAVTGDGFVTGDGTAAAEGDDYSVTGSQKVAGSSANSFTYTLKEGTKAGNYNITKVEGTLTVLNREAKYEISPRAKSDTVMYDGGEHEVSGFVTDTFEVEGNTYKVSGLTAEGSGTDAGEYTVNVSGTAVVKDSDGTDVSEEFSVAPQTGTLTVNKRSVTLTSASDSKEYDGDALTNDTVTVSGDGFAEGEGVQYRVTGTRTVVGTSENSFNYTLDENTKADNYDITTSYGTLTVNNRNTKYEVTLKANSATEKYDGTEKRVTGYKIDGEEGGTFTASNGRTYTISGMTAQTSGTDAGAYTVNVTGTPTIKDGDNVDVTAQFAVSVESGTLTINKRVVTLTSDTESKVYDGKALTSEKITVSGDGFAEDESVDYAFTGSQTLPGESDNAFTYELVDANPGNYDITTAYGKLTVNERSGEGNNGKYKITVKANSGTFTYDGKEHTVTGFETLEYSFNDVTYTVSGISASASLTDAGETAVEIKGIPKVTDEDGNDLTGNFDIVCEAGTLTVSKCPQEKPDSLSSRKASSDTAKNGVISGLDEKKLYEYSEDGGVTWTKADDGLAEITGIGAGDVLVRYQEEENSLPGIAVKVTIGIKEDQTKPSKDDIVITNASEENVSDGEISGVDDTMEYSLDDGRNWTAVEENQTVIDNLPVGEVKIRLKGDDDKNPSESIKISIGVTSRTQGVVNFRSDESPVPVETSVESAQSSNIDEYAETQVEEGRDVKIELVITPRNEEDIAEASVTEIAKVSSEVLSSIEAENIETEYLEIDLAKYVDNNKEDILCDH